MDWWHWQRAATALASWIRTLIGPDRGYRLRYGPGEQSYVQFDTREIVIDPQVIDRLGGSHHLPLRWRGMPVERLEQLQWHSCRAMARHEAAHVLFTATATAFAGPTHQRLWNALEDGRIERRLGARYRWCWADFVTLGRVALAHLQHDLPEDRVRRCLAACLLHRWDVLRRSRTPSCLAFNDETDAAFWEDEIRPLVEDAWQAADAGQVADLALEILRRLGLPQHDAGAAHAIPMGLERILTDGERATDDRPEPGAAALLRIAAHGMGLDGDDEDDPPIAGVEVQAEPPRIDVDPAEGRLWSRPYQALEAQVIGAARRLARQLAPPTPNSELRPSPSAGRFDARSHIRSRGETPLLRRMGIQPDPSGLAVVLLIDRTGSMGNGPGRIDKDGNPSAQFTNPRGRMVHARAAAMLLERACALAGIPLAIGYAGNNVVQLHLPDRPTITLPTSVTWIRTWATPPQAEGSRALIAGLYGDAGDECLSASLRIAQHELQARPQPTKLIIYIHDGEPTDEPPGEAAQTVAAVRRDGIHVVGLFVGDQDELAGLEAIFGAAHTIGVADLTRLPERLGTLVRRYWSTP